MGRSLNQGIESEQFLRHFPVSESLSLKLLAAIRTALRTKYFDQSFTQRPRVVGADRARKGLPGAFTYVATGNGNYRQITSHGFLDNIGGALTERRKQQAVGRIHPDGDFGLFEVGNLVQFGGGKALACEVKRGTGQFWVFHDAIVGFVRIEKHDLARGGPSQLCSALGLV